MAGIGFELKKLFKQGSVFSTLRGVAYASLTTIGPMVLIMTVLLIMYGVLGYMNVPIIQRELLSSTFLYAFIFSMIVAAPVSIVLSRYIADKIFEERQEDILPSYYVGLLISVVLCALLGVPFCIAEVVVGGVDPLFVFVSYWMFTELVITFFSMTYIAALKEYRQIAKAYIIGLSIVLLLGFFLQENSSLSTIEVILYSFTVGFCITALLLFSQVRSFFRVSSRNYREVLSYFKRFRALVASNLFYTLGLYSHNFVFWFSDLYIIVAKVFRSAPSYDMASCLAMFTNISLTVTFVVRVETRFHEKYQTFCEAVIGGRKSDINYARTAMFRTLTHEMWFVIQMQIVITTAIFFAALIFLPQLGFSGMTLTIYPVLTAAYLVIFVTQSFTVFLYYIEDYRGAVYTTLAFWLGTIAASIFARDFLQPSLYGLGAFIGAFIGWSVCYYRLRYMERNFDQQIFCRGHVVSTRYAAGPVSTVLTGATLERRGSA